MINYPEFSHLRIVEDKQNHFSTLFSYEDGSLFYIEPVFYTQLLGFKQRYPNEFPLILKQMEIIVKKNRLVVFTGDFESSPTEAEGAIYLEITDITNPLHIYVEDKSRGSDYGD